MRATRTLLCLGFGLLLGGCEMESPAYYPDSADYQSDAPTEIAPAVADQDASLSARTVVVESGNVAFAEPPPLVLVEPDLYVAEDSDDPVYYVDGGYWRETDGRWFCASNWDAPWTFAAEVDVPDRIRYRPKGEYRHYHRDRAHVWQEPRHHELAGRDRFHPSVNESRAVYHRDPRHMPAAGGGQSDRYDGASPWHRRARTPAHEQRSFAPTGGGAERGATRGSRFVGSGARRPAAPPSGGPAPSHPRSSGSSGGARGGSRGRSTHR